MNTVKFLRRTLIGLFRVNKYTPLVIFLLFILIFHWHVISRISVERNEVPAGYETFELNAWKIRLEHKKYPAQDYTDIRPVQLRKNSVLKTESVPINDCPDPSPFLIGKSDPDQSLRDASLTEFEVLVHHPDVQLGGQWSPSTCKARWKIAIIIPFRDRHNHLTRLLNYMIPLLKRQLVDFRFIVAEQFGANLFNKGRIFNAAFIYASKMKVDCVIFHDVDLLPVDDRNLYNCPANPRHIAAWVDTLGYRLMYDHMFGGVAAIKMKQFETVNGFSNSYWGWGGEDDDMGKRIISRGYPIERPDSVQGEMTMIRHLKRKAIAPRLIDTLLVNATLRMAVDGLNNPDNWHMLQARIHPLYHHLLINVGEPPVEWQSGDNKLNTDDTYDYSENDETAKTTTRKKTTDSKVAGEYDYLD